MFGAPNMGRNAACDISAANQRHPRTTEPDFVGNEATPPVDLQDVAEPNRAVKRTIWMGYKKKSFWDAMSA